MKMLIQRVQRASVTIDDKVTGKINNGLLILLGIKQGDTESTADKLLNKALKMRIFEDTEGKINLSLNDIGGKVLVVSQFTLYADCRKGNRPGFTNAAKPDEAKKLYQYVLDQCRKETGFVASGQFGADMKVELVNDGPFTILLDSEEI